MKKDTSEDDEDAMKAMKYLHERGGTVEEGRVPKRLAKIAFALTYDGLVKYRDGRWLALTRKGKEAAERGTLKEPPPAPAGMRRRGRSPDTLSVAEGISIGNRSSTDVDRHVGRNVRRHRVLMGLSQTELGEKLSGLTFQQVQKYERGTSRISATRLWQLAKIFELSVEDLFAGLDAVPSEVDEEMLRLMERNETKSLATMFIRLDPLTRSSIKYLARELGPKKEADSRIRHGRRRRPEVRQDA